ncbi:MAG TPA: glycosyltransferase family 4 protein [Acidobacteriaceae bacterium]
MRTIDVAPPAPVENGSGQNPPAVEVRRVAELPGSPGKDSGPRAASRAGAELVVRRIVHMAKHCGYGNGNVHVAVDLACVQADQGCSVVFVSGGGTFEPLLAQHGVRHLRIEQDQRRPFSLLSAAWQLWRLVRRERFEVLHAHMMGSAVIGYLVSLLTGVPLVTTVHNSFDRHSILMRLGRRVVAVSLAEKRDLLRQGYPPAKVDVVMNAPVRSPREPFMVNPKPVTLASPSILSVCGLHRRKGVFDLITASAVLFGEMPEWTLYLAGEGPHREELEAQAHALGIAARVVFLGFVPAPRTLLEQCDVFTLCSYADPCSLVIGEARGAGCAIVATAVGGTPEMLEFGRAGRLVPPGSPVQLAAELRSLMRDPEARAALRQASRTGAEVFDVHRLLADYDGVYARARGARQGASR